jgi:hypothetical protein
MLGFQPSPLTLSELEERLAVAERYIVQLDEAPTECAVLTQRAAQCRTALDACRALNFGPNLRRALAAKVRAVESDARTQLVYQSQRALWWR